MVSEYFKPPKILYDGEPISYRITCPKCQHVSLWSKIDNAFVCTNCGYMVHPPKYRVVTELV